MTTEHNADMRSDYLPRLDRLRRRGKVTISATDSGYELRFKAPGPYQGRAWCTQDEGDLWSHCHLGARDWQGEGPDLDALVAECDDATEPRRRDIDEMAWSIEQRRLSRTHGPPLPSYRRWDGWRPGQERWLRTSSHASEYLGGYLHDLRIEQDFEDENAAIALLRRTRRQFATKAVLQ